MIKKIETQFQGVDVLVAEDYELNREIIYEMLNLMGINADMAEDGEQAVEKAKNKHYHLVLMDLLMPKMDGYAATRAIRALDIEQPVILALTASALPGDRGKCIEAGMNDFVSKPLDIWDLEAILLKYLAPFKK